MQRTRQRAVFYTRDSGGRHETTPREYVGWAQKKCAELNVSFHPNPADIDRMIRGGESIRGDLYLDFEVSGNKLSRTGLDAFIARAIEDEQVSHVMIPRRDRFARPDDPIDAVKMENALRHAGLTIVFMDRILEPLSKGVRHEMGELITAMIDYDSAGKFRRELSEKMIYSQIALAKAGFSTGGRPPFGFDRWLAKEDGTAVRKLQDGEIVRMAGHHVVWLPATDERLDLALRIRRMLLTTPASRVAAILTEEGIPSPNAGKYRTDGGVRHLVSGVWHQNTVANIGRNPLLVAVVQYGKRSMGDQTRFTPDGPRELKDEDIRPDGRPKIVANDAKDLISSAAHFEAVVPIEEHDELQRVLDSRATSQKGKPRSHDPNRNPLGTRVYDLECSWPMYRVQQGKSFRYKCGLYQQSHGKRCNHNHVDGSQATQFVLSCIRQRLLSPGLMPKLETKLRQLAAADEASRGGGRVVPESEQIKSEIEATQKDIARVQRNLALADSEEKHKAISAVHDELTAQLRSLQSQLATVEVRECQQIDPESEVAAAIQSAQHLTELANTCDFSAATELIRATDARLFLGFHKVAQGKRKLNRLQRGVIVFGDSPEPIQRYSGPTNPDKLKKRQSDSGEESQSLRNVSRDDRI